MTPPKLQFNIRNGVHTAFRDKPGYDGANFRQSEHFNAEYSTNAQCEKSWGMINYSVICLARLTAHTRENGGASNASIVKGCIDRPISNEPIPSGVRFNLLVLKDRRNHKKQKTKASLACSRIVRGGSSSSGRTIDIGCTPNCQSRMSTQQIRRT